MKKIVRLNESELKTLIKESVRRILSEEEMIGNDIPMDDNGFSGEEGMGEDPMSHENMNGAEGLDGDESLEPSEEEYAGLGPELSQDEKWADYDKAEDEFRNSHSDNFDWPTEGGEDMGSGEPLGKQPISDEELSGVVAEAIKRVLSRKK